MQIKGSLSIQKRNYIYLRSHPFCALGFLFCKALLIVSIGGQDAK